MKKILLILAFFSSVFSGIAQGEANQENTHLDPAKLPVVVLTAFTAEHPGITAIWKADGENFKAAFNDPTTKLGRIIVYDKEGKVVRTENEVDQSGIPPKVGEFYHKNYPGEKYQLWSTQDASGDKTYYSGRNMDVIWFDKNGEKVQERKVKGE